MPQQNVYHYSRSERKLPKPSKIPAAQRNSTGRLKPPQSYGFKDKVKPFKHIASNQDIYHEINRTLPERSLNSKSPVRLSTQRSVASFQPKFDHSETLNR